MEFDLIGYRYGTDELGLIAGLLGYDCVAALQISIPTGMDYEIAGNSLECAGLLMEMDSEKQLDDVTALLVEGLCLPSNYISITEDNSHAVILHPEGYYLLAQKIADGYVLKPAQNADDLLDEIVAIMADRKSITAVLTKPEETETFNTDANGILSLIRNL